MTHLWHRENPSLYETEQRTVETQYPDLNLAVVGDFVHVRGAFPVMFEGHALDRYSVELQLARDHPKSLPVVREVGGRIPRHADRHIISNDGTACVLLPDERWRFWPPGAPLLNFLTGPLHSFFLAQSLVERGDPWPFGQWSHGAIGIVEFYSEMLGTKDIRMIARYLDYLASKEIKGHWPCPCHTGRRLRDCHMKLLLDLRSKIARKDATNSLNMINNSGLLTT